MQTLTARPAVTPYLYQFLSVESVVKNCIGHAFHTWPGLVLITFIALRLSTIQGDQSASS